MLNVENLQRRFFHSLILKRCLYSWNTPWSVLCANLNQIAVLQGWELLQITSKWDRIRGDSQEPVFELLE